MQKRAATNLAAQFNNLPATRLNFSGTLRVLVYEGPLSPEELNITRQPEVAAPEEKVVETEAPEANAEVTEK